MGKKSEALTLLLDSSDNIDGAVQFCLDQNDHELWKELIDLSVSNPQHIKGLLKIVGQYVDPLLIIKRIPEGMEIPGLRDALQVVLRDSTDRQVIYFADSYVFLLTNIGNVEKHRKNCTKRRHEFGSKIAKKETKSNFRRAWNFPKMLRLPPTDSRKRFNSK